MNPIAPKSPGFRTLKRKPLPNGYQFCELGPKDKSEIFETIANRGWEGDNAKWDYLLKQGDCVGLRHQGELVGTAGVNKYEDKTATLAMILVKDGHGGKGLGTALTQECLERCDNALPTLYASPDGKPLYERKFGFQEIGGSKIHLGDWKPVAESKTSSVRKATEGDWDAIVALDAEANGAQRESLLQHLQEDASHAVVSTDGSEITGFALKFDAPDSTVIGPILAKEPGLAKGLISELMAQKQESEKPIKIQLNDSFSELSNWLEQNGMPAVARLPLMTLGGKALPGKPEWEVAISGYPYG